MKNFAFDRTGRAFIVIVLIVAVTVPFIFYIFYYGAIIPGINKDSDNVKAEIKHREKINQTIEGNIVDSTGDIITYADTEGVPARCDYKCYSQLVGYNSVTKNTYGLRSRYWKYLYSAGSDHKGATIKLTTINKIQRAAYEAIRDTDGCAVVLENRTGRIIALATTNPQVEMDVNDLDSNWKEMNSVEGFFIPNWKKALAPGSSIKPLVGTLIYDEGKADTEYNDTGKEKIDGYTFRNSNKASYGKISLRLGIVNSCNTYFSHMSDEIGKYKLMERMEAFNIGKDLELDFTTISSQHNLSDSTRAEYSAAGFGQGRLLLTPINIAMTGQAIANKGVMLKPYLIDSIYNDSKTFLSGGYEELGQSCSEEAADYVSDCMLDAAEHYGIDRSLGIHAKTGTAELAQDNRAVFLSFNSEYTVCIVENYTDKFGKDLKNSALMIYSALDSLHQ